MKYLVAFKEEQFWRAQSFTDDKEIEGIKNAMLSNEENLSFEIKTEQEYEEFISSF